jgi:protein SCO1/2
MKLFKLIIYVTITLLLLSSCNKDKPEQQADLPPGGDFTLTDHNGKSFSTEDLRGKTFLVYFGYTLCPDACPLTMSRLRSVYNILGKSSNDMVILFVSVDPKRDTPEKLKQYLKQFDLNTIGLSGSPEEIRKAADLYKIYYNYVDSGSEAGYLVDHTTLVFLIDKTGKIRYQFRHSDPVELMASVIRLLL